MKTCINIVVLFSLLFFTSCEDWLDLKPETQSTEDELFSTVDGYRSVLNGLYKSMASADLYGRELSFGMLTCMSQQYDLTSNVMSEQKYLFAEEFEYENTKLKPTVDKVWKSGFNVIANANNLIQNLEKTSPDIFAMGDVERNLMLGEAYACRAMMHFDLLRLFAPAPISGDQGSYVPYVEKFPDIVANGIGVDAFLEKVIKDLVYAQELTIDFDTTDAGKCLMKTNKSRFENVLGSASTAGYAEANAYDDFFKGRGYRLNYYSISAMLARVYMYAGRYDDALEMVNIVKKYNMISDSSYGSIIQGVNLETSENLKMLSSVLFALYNEKAYTALGIDSYFAKKLSVGTGKIFVMKKSLFEAWNDEDESSLDPRYNTLKYLVNDVYPISGKYYASETESVRNKNVTLVPMFRYAELEYIRAECYARQQDWTQVSSILRGIRMSRGMRNEVSVNNWNDFVKMLVCDARREWIGEGQMFFMYKRLNVDVDFGEVKRPLSKAESVLPIPDNQSM